MPVHGKRSARAAIGAAVAALTLIVASGASALCIQNCPPYVPPPLALVGSQAQGVGVWTLSTRVGGSNQTQSFYDVDGDVGGDQIGLTTFTATGPTGTPITVTAEDTRFCESLLGDPSVPTTSVSTASGNGRATVSFFPTQTCPPDALLLWSVQKASATQGALSTPTVTFDSNFFYNAEL